jgi:tRNA pseudouridine55 synthase
VERQARPVTVYSIDIISFDEKSGEGVLDISCSKGTYVRTIIHDIGQALGCGGVMTSLVRTSSGGFTLDDCVTLEQLEQLRDKGCLESTVIPVERLFEALPAIVLDERKTVLYKNGVKLRFDQLCQITESDSYRVYGSDGFIGIGKADFNEKILRVGKNLY